VQGEIVTGSGPGPQLNAGADTIDTIIEVATWFYLHGWSQVEIARSLDLDPSTVSRYLKRARDESIVRIEIQRPPRPTEQLEREVADRLGLARVVVVPPGEDAVTSVAVAAAEHLSGLLRSRARLGVSWGNTLGAVVRHLRAGSVTRLTIAQLAGGLDDSSPGIQGHDLVRSLGSTYPGSRLSYLHAPAIVDTPVIRDAILSDRSVRDALRVAAASEVALVGIGTVDGDATLVRGGHVSASDLRHLVQGGAVGNLNTRFFDTAGQPVGDLDGRTIAVEWEALRAIPTVVAVAAGAAKTAAVAGAARTRAVDVLVIDEGIARTLVA
jgi:DNA-binding transcriptional regulator LsrR (DeoR family)